jgi:hypothetical protein
VELQRDPNRIQLELLLSYLNLKLLRTGQLLLYQPLTTYNNNHNIPITLSFHYRSESYLKTPNMPPVGLIFMIAVSLLTVFSDI